jgi:hypothetical protein
MTVYRHIKTKLNNITACLVLSVALALTSCSTDHNDNAYQVGYDYFPAFQGKWLHYDVDSTIWDDFTSQTYYTQSQILVLFESIITDAEGEEAFRIERHYRNSDTAQWVIRDVWFANVKPASVQLVEENVRLIKMSFPIRSGIKWNGNALNYLPSEIYEYQDVFKANSIGGYQYDSTVTVLQSNTINLIEEDIRYEIYARDVGMIHKYIKTIQKNIAQPGSIVSGVLIEYTLRDYSKL